MIIYMLMKLHVIIRPVKLFCINLFHNIISLYGWNLKTLKLKKKQLKTPRCIMSTIYLFQLILTTIMLLQQKKTNKSVNKLCRIRNRFLNLISMVTWKVSQTFSRPKPRDKITTKLCKIFLQKNKNFITKECISQPPTHL